MSLMQNTPKSTVIGELQGPKDKIGQMKARPGLGRSTRRACQQACPALSLFAESTTLQDWLQTTGSPGSKIDKCEFSNEKSIDDYTFSDFEQR